MGRERLQPGDIAANYAVYDILSRFNVPNGWNEGSQQRNFNDLLKIAEFSGIPIKGRAALDVGCGTGDFSQVWKSRGGGSYIGVDIYPPSIDKARAAYPSEKFEVVDILDPDAGVEEGDFAFASGTLSVRQASRDNYDFMRDMVKRMLELSRVGIAFNFLTDEKEPDEQLFMYNAQRVLELCREVTPHAQVVLEDNHDAQQGTIFIWRAQPSS